MDPGNNDLWVGPRSGRFYKGAASRRPHYTQWYCHLPARVESSCTSGRWEPAQVGAGYHYWDRDHGLPHLFIYYRCELGSLR